MTSVSLAKRAVDVVLDQLAPSIGTFMSAYVRQPSVNEELGGSASVGQERQAQTWLASELEAWGVFDDVDVWEVTANRPDLAAVLRGSGGGRALLFNGHTDVVPTGELSDWTVDPWGGEIRDGRVYGRGATDMKGGNAAFLFAQRALRAAGITLRGDVIGSVVIGEESGNRRSGVDAVLERGYTAPLCIVAEPTNLQIAAAITGELYVKLRVPGRATHLANRPQSVWPSPMDEPPGVNAIEKMMKVLRALIELERDWGVHVRHPAMPPGHMTLNVATIQGGTYISALPADCEAVMSVLFAPSYTVEEIAGEIEQVVQRAAANDLWLRDHPPVLEWPHVVPGKQPVDVTAHEGHAVLKGAFASATGKPAQSMYASFTSDANFLVEAGQPALMFGPGDLSMGTHGPDEYIPLDDIVTAARVFAHFIVDWCGVDAVKPADIGGGESSRG